jgi:hypothetical protein
MLVGRGGVLLGFLVIAVIVFVSGLPMVMGRGFVVRSSHVVVRAGGMLVYGHGDGLPWNLVCGKAISPRRKN